MMVKILLVVALLSFLVGLIDYPPVGSARMISLGLFLCLLVYLIK